MATSEEPEPFRVWLKPLARARKPSRTATTSAIDTTVASDIQSRWGMDRIFIRITDPVWFRRLTAGLLSVARERR